MILTDTLTTGVTFTVTGTVMISDTSSDGSASFDIRITNSVKRTDAFISTRFVFADSTRSTGVGFSTKRDSTTLSIRKELVSMRTDTESGRVASVDTFLVRRAGRTGSAVHGSDEAVVVLSEIVRWTATDVGIETDQVPRTVVGHSTLLDRQTHLVRIPLVSWWTGACCFMILCSTERVLTTGTLEVRISCGAWIITLASISITLLGGGTIMVRRASSRFTDTASRRWTLFVTFVSLGVTLEVVGTISIMEADRDRRVASLRTISIADKRRRTGALVPAGKVGATGTRTTGDGFFETFIDVFTLVMSTDISTTTVRVKFTIKEHFGALFQWIPCVSWCTGAVCFMLL